MAFLSSNPKMEIQEMEMPLLSNGCGKHVVTILVFTVVVISDKIANQCNIVARNTETDVKPLQNMPDNNTN